MRRVVLVAFLSSTLLALGGVVLSMYFSMNHLPQTESSAALAAGIAGFSLIPLSGALEWYLPPRKASTGISRILIFSSTGIIIAAVAYWAVEAISSLSSPISSNQTFNVGLYLSLGGLASYIIAGMISANITRADSC